MVRKLTLKQHRFVLALYEGMTQRQAWIRAGYSSNYPDINIDVNACKLANTTRIKQRYNELIELGMTSPAIATVQERKSILTDIARNGDPKHQIPAISEHNKMDQVYSTSPIGNTDVKLVIVVDGNAGRVIDVSNHEIIPVIAIEAPDVDCSASGGELIGEE